VTYVVLSHYECIGAGSLLHDGEEVRSFATQEEAVHWFSLQWNSILASVTDELDSIKTSPHLQLDSPYIIWAILLNITNEGDSDTSTDKLLEELFSNTDESKSQKVLECVMKFNGYRFEPDRSNFDLGSAIWSFKERYS